MVAIAAVTGEGETLTMTESATARAGLRRVERTDELDYNPSFQGLVFFLTSFIRAYYTIQRGDC